MLRQLGALSAALEAAGWPAPAVVFTVGSHTYDGRPEATSNVRLRQRIRAGNVGGASWRAVMYEVRPDVAARTLRVYHNLARETAVRVLPPDARFVLLLDADELPKGAALTRWMERAAPVLREDHAYKLACHWYFQSPCWRARAVEDSVLLVSRSVLLGPCDSDGVAKLRDERECDGIVARMPGGVVRMVMGGDTAGRPMFHHFSWVRTREGLEHKVRTWGHKGDRPDWQDIVHRVWELKEPPPGGDPVHSYVYDILDAAPLGLRLSPGED